MTPLLFAAALSLMGPLQHPLDAPPPASTFKALPAAPSIRGFVLKDVPSARDCSDFARQAADPDGAALKKLGELPPGLLEHAVLRIVHGCPVREIVFAGQTYWLGVPDPKLERLDPIAHRTVQH